MVKLVRPLTDDKIVNQIMISVIINAYACAPNKGSEPGLGWNWVIHLAKYCKLHVITEGEWKDEIDAELKKIPYSENITFYYNPVSDNIRQMCWNQGDWRFYYYYQKWQKEALQIAKTIIQNNSIDIVHQFNMIGFREPGYLWKIKNIPFIWGPVDAKESFPVKYLSEADLKLKFKIYLKNYITKLQITFGYRVRMAAKRSAVLLAASSESVATFKKYYNLNSVLLNETGCYPTTNNQYLKKDNSGLQLLWVGKFELRKQLSLALKTIAQLKESNVKLHIVGGTSAEELHYKKEAETLQISDKCIWHGKIKHAEVQQLMQQSDIFFFTSVAEGTPHVVLEAIGNKLPVVCFDCCGQGDTVTNEIGRKIKLSTPTQSVTDFSVLIKELATSKEVLNQLSGNCAKKQKELSWENKAQKMIEYYNQVIS
jgi:glycosyltransferase involved in cell wall biosynthesis